MTGATLVLEIKKHSQREMIFSLQVGGINKTTFFDTNTMKYSIYISSFEMLLILFLMKWDQSYSCM